MSKSIAPACILRRFINLTQLLPEKFKRTRRWSPRSVMVWLMVITIPARKLSYRNAEPILKRFGCSTFGWTTFPSISSISTARRKMTVSICRQMLRAAVSRCQTAMGRVKHRFGERRFIAFDGTRLITRRSGDTARKLHRYRCPDGSRVHNPQGLMVAAVDVFRRLPLDWVMVGKGTGERTALLELLNTLALSPGDVAIMDRGLPSRNLFAELIERKIDVVARMSTADAGSWKEIAGFLKTGKKSAVISVLIGERPSLVPIRVRVVERDRQRGRPRKGTVKERMVILTTLREEDGFGRKELIAIYAARWGVETLFRELKSFLGIEPFHTDFVDGCEQEIAASFIWMALASAMQSEAESTLDGRRIVRADCLRSAADLVYDLMQGRSITERAEEYIQVLRRYSYAPRPNRHAPRECKMPYGRWVSRGTR